MYSRKIVSSPAMKPERSPGADERFEIELITKIFLNVSFPAYIEASRSDGIGVLVYISL